MRANRFLLNSAALGLLAATTPSIAQEVPQETAATEDTGDAIIVTARRQNERLQDVPASVSVLTASALQNTGAVKAEDFTQLTPGVTIVTGTAEAGDTQINIRGINGARDAESSVALTGFPVNPPGGIGQIPVPFIFAPANGSTFGPYSPTTCDGTQCQLRQQENSVPKCACFRTPMAR